MPPGINSEPRTLKRTQALKIRGAELKTKQYTTNHIEMRFNNTELIRKKAGAI